MTHWRTRTIPGLALAATFGGLLTLLWPATPRDVASRRARWAAVAPRNYSIEIRARCFCSGNRIWYRVTVREGVPVSQAPLDSTGRRDAVQPPMRSVDSLYALIEHALLGPRERSMHLRVRYDPTWHYPRSIAADLSRSYDDEFVIEARKLTVLPAGDADAGAEERRPTGR